MLALRRVETCLDEVLAFGLRDERLEFCGREGVYESGFGNDEKQDLCACER
jgi:hypothetical protein